MAEYNKYLFTAGAADVTSEVMDSSRMDNLFVQVTATVTAATLQATLALASGIVPADGPVLPTVTPIAASVLPASVTIPASGLITFNNLPIGTHHLLFRLAAPGPASLAIFDYTSGGGTVSIVVRAYGWKFAS